MTHTVLLFYRYVTIPDPASEREYHLELCYRLGLKGRILIGEEGINGTVAGSREGIAAYREEMDNHPLFGGIEYKVDEAKGMPFPRLQVKVRSEIVTLGAAVDRAMTAPRLSPEEFNDMIQDPDVVIFDARNNYESAIGKFRGAITPDISLFKDLPEALEDYEELKDKTIVTYCTGGIRCEKVSALMKSKGFKNVYQLDGGIIKYGQSFPDGAWEGECFVFDERMKVAFKDEPKLLGRCHFCEASTNTYRNCAYKPCNRLILVCEDCDESMKACSDACALSLGTPIARR